MEKQENQTKKEEKPSFFSSFFKSGPNLEYELYKKKKTIGRTLQSNVGKLFNTIFEDLLYN